MIITKHIAFYYKRHRVCYVNTIIEATNKYEHTTDIFIHTNNNNLTTNVFSKYTNGTINIVWHDLSKIHPHYLTWKCRALLYDQRNSYDIFMYIEDDILVSNKTLVYWLENKDKVMIKNFNLGFVRVEIDENNEEYMTDLNASPQYVIDKGILIDGTICALNDKNTYCAFWIYDQKEFIKFTESIYYNIENIPGEFGTREKSAIGLHGKFNYWYKGTLIPIINEKLVEECKVYHLTNNYTSDKSSGVEFKKFNDVINYKIFKIYLLKD
jgi:hypothetical protein